MPSIRSVFVGQPKVMADARGEWTSSIARDRGVWPDRGYSVRIKEGDRVTQPFHGSLDAAICCQPADHYRFWRDRHSMALEDGSVGENFTLAEVTDDEVCATDVVKAGTAFAAGYRAAGPVRDARPAHRTGGLGKADGKGKSKRILCTGAGARNCRGGRWMAARGTAESGCDDHGDQS